MTDLPPPQPPADEPSVQEPQAAPAAKAQARRRRSAFAWVLIGLATVAAVLLLLGGLARWGVLLPQARALIEARTSGLKIGRYGKLKIEGLSGDIWRDFSIRRLTVTDEKGVWLQGTQLQVHWNPLPLLHRRLIIDQLRAGKIQVLRRPTLTPKGVSKAAPVSVEIKDAAALVETLPAFSSKYGLFDARVKLDLERAGGQVGEANIDSRLHAGDHLHARFNLPKGKPFAIDADALEAQGGALAGAAGLPANQPFSARIVANGSAVGGRVDAHIFSGTSQPLQAVGAWDKGGGLVQGQATLGASTLLKSYADMFGPQVRFAVAGRRGAGTDYGVGVRVRAENLMLAVKGRVDAKTRTAPDGLYVDAYVPQFKRVAKVPYVDTARAVGRVQGSQASWRFKGDTTLGGVTLNGYSLVRVSGPLQIAGTKGEIRAQANLGGAGGRGQGLVPGLAGASPKLFVDLSRFPDGRVLIRSVKLVGSGFTLSGSGSRSLFGGLKFKGDATVFDIGRVRPGAGGSVRATFDASQAAGQNRPWVLAFDAQTQRFRSGVQEVDRLLGPSPRLTANGDFRDGTINIGKAHLVATAASVNASGLVKVAGPMNLALDWTAKGPFQAGPVEIAGDWRGKGTLGGTMAAPSADLSAHIARLDIPQLPLREADVSLKFQKIANTFDGAVGLSGQSDYGPARARSAFRFMPGGVDLSMIDADAAGIRAQGAVSLRGGAPSSADLKVAIGPGLLLAKGSASGTVKLVKAAGPAQAELDLVADNAVVRGSAVAIKSAHLTASGPMDRLPYRLQASGASGVTPFTIAGAGVYQLRDKQQTITLSGQGEVRTVAFKTLDPLTVQIGPDGRSVHARIGTASGEAVLNARDAGGQLTATGGLTNIDLKALNPDFVGRITGQLALNGRGERLEGDIDAKLSGARMVGAPDTQSLDAEVRGHLSDSRLTLALTGSSQAGLRAKANVVLPTEASASPLRLAINRTKPMGGEFDIDGEVKPLWDLFQGGNRSLSGTVRLAGKFGGTLADPRIAGRASVRNGGFEDYGTGVKLTKLQADAELGADVITLTSLTANDHKSGQVSGSGTLSLQRGGGSNLKLQLTNFRLIDNDTAIANATGEVNVVRAADGKIRIGGDLRINKAEINAEAKLRPGVVSMDVVEIHRPENLSTQLPARKTAGLSIALDVRLRAPGGVMVRGRGIIAQFSVFAHVTGSTTNPVLDGTARVVDGFYDFAGRRFQFEQRGSISLDTDINRIRLDLAATLSDPSLSATVQIRGTAAKPEVTLTSSPALPEDEILAYIIFGRSASQLSTPEAAQMASVLSSLAAGGGFDVLGNLREFAGLDRLAFGADQAGGVTVAGGKYVTNNIYVELVGGGVYGAQAQVDWRVKRSFSIVSTLGGQFGSKIAVRWRKDIGGGGRRGNRTSAGGATAPPPPNRNH